MQMTIVETKLPLLSTFPPYIYRDLSLLEFQRRVLEQAQDEKTPLLERVKFLAIFGSNMDEFFMLRVPNLRRRIESSESGASQELTAELTAVHTLACDLYTAAAQCWNQEIIPQLEKSGIRLLNDSRLNKHQKERVYNYFKKTILPLLIPLPLSYGHAFPHISNLYLNLAVVLQERKGAIRLMRLQVPDTLPRLFPVKWSSGKSRKNGKSSDHYSFIWLEQIIIDHLDEIFPDQKILAVHPFRIIRDAALRADDLEVYDPLDNVEQSIQQINLQRREFGAVTQVAIHKDMPEPIRSLLAQILKTDQQDFYIKGNPLGLRSLWELYNNVEREDLKYRKYKPVIPKPLKHISRAQDIFTAIRHGNILLHHPYDSFSPVVDYLSFAARDPRVLSIQQTLYRVGKDSPVVKSLMDASIRGKEVTAVIELKATFDEESNMEWAHLLEQAGVNVVHGLPGLKTHCKIGMVLRQEKDGLRRYVHLSTGNYNTVTTRMYEDIGMFTCDPIVAQDAANLLKYLTGDTSEQKYQKCLVAPFNLRQRLEALIRREMDHSRAGFPARLIFKVNSLTDVDMINLMYEASRAGVEIDLFVRGMCRLRPGVEGMSQTIRVTSIVGRYLEHSRIFYFFNRGQEQIYLGSADLMERNLNRRVELLFPVEDPQHIRHICEDVLNVYLRDNQLAYALQPDGSYKYKVPGRGERPVNVQNWLMHARRRS